MSVVQDGAIAAGNAHVQIAVTITNRTSAPIHVYHDCHYASVLAHVVPVDNQGLQWTQDTSGCPIQLPLDDPEIAPSAAYTYRYTADLSQSGFHTGVYRVTSEYKWHQSTSGIRVQVASGHARAG